MRHKPKGGYCGPTISAENGTSLNGEVIRYYKYLGRKKYRNGYVKTALHKEFLENIVLERNILIEQSKTKITLSEDKIRKYYEQVLLKEPPLIDTGFLTRKHYAPQIARFAPYTRLYEFPRQKKKPKPNTFFEMFNLGFTWWR